MGGLSRVHIPKYYDQSYGYRVVAWCGWHVPRDRKTTNNLTHPYICKRCVWAYNKAVEEATR